MKPADVCRGEDEGYQSSEKTKQQPSEDYTTQKKLKSLARGSLSWIAGVGDVCNRTSRRDTIQSTTTRNEKAMKASGPNWTGSKGVHGLNPARKSKRSALQQHCAFWDTNGDGLVYPWDIFIGFRRLGFNIALCLWAAITMAACSSYATQTSWLPHPLFAINIDNIHRSRHGSTTGTYDLEAEIDMRRFDAIFNKYADGKDYLTWKTLYGVWAGQCCANDWFGWFAGGLEWIALYILLWPQDGKLRKEDILGVYDGTIFSKIADQHARARA
ncbi:hypothetical protein ACEQ8H_007302 [Pleosporales sp. CAS-2024a]